ncbi:P-type cation-transporting ATPase 2 [Colletotrichum chlorophyti]|uniref:P-type cation-transporting ATPase 2 n=1 Tax=Colletotrichum chlorophyti TaxID=708187 RepID=A0A1Q8S5J2_9PEZI|nr:P-type cation-transporting ATPase 2 [Colletotrichum chlorophyti]
MACGSGCCGPPSEDPATSSPDAQQPFVSPGTPSDVESCCGDDSMSCVGASEAQGDCRAAETDAKGCEKGCCGSTDDKDPSSNSGVVIAGREQISSSVNDGARKIGDGCKEGCCGSGEAQIVSIGSVTTAGCEKKADTPKGKLQDMGDVCKKGCCGSAVAEAVVIAGDGKSAGSADNCRPQPAVQDVENGKQGCCGSEEVVVPKSCSSEKTGATANCCGSTPKVKVEDCKKGCCGSDAEHNISDNGDKLQEGTMDDCKKGCCSSADPVISSAEEKAPSCCEGKTSPCCDSTCIERLALRECASTKSSTPHCPGKAFSSSDTCTGGQDGKACRGHARSVREMYQAKLEALGCICRALLALGQESCCAPRERTSVERRRSSIKSSRSRASVDSCCPPGTKRSGCGTKARAGAGKVSRAASPGLKDRSCAGAECCTEPKAPSITASCADACCADKKPSGTIVETIDQVPKGNSNRGDLEKGLSGREHVILSISGMTCTGCETKLKRTLATVGAVKNLKTSLVLARAEFDLDLAAGTVVEVMKHLERTTEFRCEKLTSQGSSLDILSPGDAQEFMNQTWPAGVADMRLVDKKTVHVEFDAEVVGARDLVEKGWNSPMKLAPLRADPALEAGSKHVRNMGLVTLLSTVLTIPVLVMAWAPLPKREIAYGSASLALATIVQVAIAGPFYPKALKSLIFSKVIEMDLLIVLSTSAAYIFSVVSFGYLVSHKPLSTGEFFETSTLLVTLIMVGRYVSALARQKAVESISIRSLQTSTALIVDPAGQEKEIDARLLQYGDVFKVVPDSRVPTDGMVVSGSSELDESMMTGESRTIEKFVGSSVIAGSINGSGTLRVRLTRLPDDNTISTIAGMVDEAKLSKPKIQDIADRVASYFVPVVVVLTIITFTVWIAVGIAIRKQSASEATIQAVTYAITVLIVSCPCAIGLAVPMVIVIASGVAADRGVIFKSADSIEVAYKTSHVVFDKTGTLTRGKLSIAEEQYLTKDSGLTKALLLGLVGNIKHPVSAAVATHLKAAGISPSTVSDPKILTGKGVEASASGVILRAGNSRWLGLSADPRVDSILSKGYTALCFTMDNVLTAMFGLEDSVRPDAPETISALKSAGISVHVLSGDDDGAVQTVATQLDIPGTNVRSRCTPGDKQEYIQQLLSSPTTTRFLKLWTTPTKPVVVFCGDGTNDAVALAQATIGVHMNEGTDVAKGAADVVLMRPSLTGILTAIAISRKAVHRIAFNFGWSFVYNLFAILLGSGAFVNARIPPEFAGLGELASVLPVIAAAVLLRWSKV